MSTTYITIRAGDTEPLEIRFTAIAGEEVETADLDAAVLFLRKSATKENHVDGVELTGVTVTSQDRADGTWLVTGRGSFDPVDAKKGGGNALEETGTYKGYIKVTWADEDVTRHPGDPGENIEVVVYGTWEEA